MADWVNPDADPSKYGALTARETDSDGRPVWYWPELDKRLKRFGRLHPDKAKLYEAIGYRPSKKQAEVHSSLARVRCFSGGARGGKSLFGAMELLPVLLTPGTQSWVVAPRYDQAKEMDYLRQFFEMPEMNYYFQRLRTFTFNVKNGDVRIVLQWSSPGDAIQLKDSWVQVKSTQVEDSLLGEELDLVCISEASRIPERIWTEYLIQRLTTRKGVAVIPSTPRGTGNWYGQLVQLGQVPDERKNKRVESLCVTSVENPIYDQSQADFAKAHLTDEEYCEQVLGIPTNMSGAIFPDWTTEIHVKDFEKEQWPPPNSDCFIGVDFGFSNPAAILWCWKDGDGVWYVSKEFYKRKQTIDDLAVAIAEGCGWDVERGEYGRVRTINEEEGVEAVFCDWEPRSIRELTELGISCQRVPSKDVDAGIRVVRKAMALRDNGLPGLFVDASALNLIRELSAYRYQEDRSRSGNTPQSEKPVKRDDHAVDSLRYCLHGASRIEGIGVM